MSAERALKNAGADFDDQVTDAPGEDRKVGNLPKGDGVVFLEVGLRVGLCLSMQKSQTAEQEKEKKTARHYAALRFSKEFSICELSCSTAPAMSVLAASSSRLISTFGRRPLAPRQHRARLPPICLALPPIGAAVLRSPAESGRGPVEEPFQIRMIFCPPPREHAGQDLSSLPSVCVFLPGFSQPG